MSDEEIHARNLGIIRALEQIARGTDETDTDEMDERFVRGLDEDRLAERERFRGCD